MRTLQRAGIEAHVTGNEIREKFLQFFERKGHRGVRSSSLVPLGDATLLFTNAGMNQFKDVFLGLEKRDYPRATSCQKCVRAGGKHNDLENVAFTKRHHTFFEMLGNFSFGDYFKKDAIAYAWELITSPQWFGIAKEKLYVTVFGGAEVAPGATLGVDEEAKGIWLAQNVAAVLQGVISNYDTDLFQPLMKRAAELCGLDFGREEALEEGKGGAASLRVIADHARATTFLISDGVLPSNEGRGYVLRKIMRRAILHSQMLSERQGALSQMVSKVIDLMKDAY